MKTMTDQEWGALPLVYVAGPYSKPDPVSNTTTAMEVGDRLLNTQKCVPVIPHLSLFQHLRTPRPYEFWLGMDMALVKRCDFILRIPGESAGADREEQFAKENDIPVVRDIALLLALLETRETRTRLHRPHRVPRETSDASPSR